jgi:hypothetical protein
VQADADVVIRKGRIRDVPPESEGHENWFRASPNQTCLVWQDVGTFLISNGREIVVDPAESVQEEYLRLAILGPVLAVVLQQRGRFPLHASSIAKDGKVAALAGESRSGKSALAAALHARGLVLVSDDITAVDVDSDRPTAYPGIPLFKLWPETVTFFGESAETLPRLHSETEKRSSPVTKGFADTPLPLDRVYILAEDSRDAVEPLTLQQSLFELTRLCYNVDLTMAAMGPAAFMRLCMQVAEGVSFFRLQRRRSLSALSDLAAMVEEHLGRDA